MTVNTKKCGFCGKRIKKNDKVIVEQDATMPVEIGQPMPRDTSNHIWHKDCYVF
jgi:hypothetical protein